MHLLHSTQFIKNLRGEALDFLGTKIELEGDDPLHHQVNIEIFGAWEVGFSVEVACDALDGDAVFGAGEQRKGHVEDFLVARGRRMGGVDTVMTLKF